MKIHDLYENSTAEFSNDLAKDVIDILMMFKMNGQPETHINNLLDELQKKDYSPSVDELAVIIDSSKEFSISGKVIIINADSPDADSKEEVVDPSVTDEEGYDPTTELAKKATKARK